MKKLQIALLLGLIIVFAGCSVDSIEKDNSESESSSQCAAEGERMRADGAGFPTECCEGLSPILKNRPCPDDQQYADIGDIFTCVACGNGVCDTKLGENKCNCPNDCTGSEKPCVEYYQVPEEDDICCDGMKPTEIGAFNEDCSKNPALTYKTVCLYCGNGFCDEKTEDKCNCPEDCE